MRSKILALLCGAAFLIASNVLLAQDKGKTDSKAQRKAAEQKCAGMKGQQHSDCMKNAVCGTSKDKAKCEAQFDQHRSQRQSARAECAKLKGAERTKCNDDLDKKKFK